MAIRRHWRMVFCAFAFCWWAYGRLPTEEEPAEERPEADLRAGSAGREAPVGVVAGGVEGGAGMAGAVGDAITLLEGVVRSAPPLEMGMLLERAFSGESFHLYAR